MTSYRAPTLSALRKAIRTGTPTRVPARPGVVGELGMCGRSLFGKKAIVTIFVFFSERRSRLIKRVPMARRINGRLGPTTVFVV